MIAQYSNIKSKNNALGVVSNYKAGMSLTMRAKPEIRGVAAASSQNREVPKIEPQADPNQKKNAKQAFWIAVGVAALLVLALKLKWIKI